MNHVKKTIDFYWDIGSTNTYFALKLLQPLAQQYNATIVWHAFNLGFVFQSNQYVLMDEPVEKLRNRRDDLNRWSARYNLGFKMPENFPIKTSRALRGAIAMRSWNKEAEYINAIFDAYWQDNIGTVGDYPTLRNIVESLGVEGAEFEALSESEESRTALIESTNNARTRGVFGAPTIIIEDELYWGKDRMEFVEDHLARMSKLSD